MSKKNINLYRFMKNLVIITLLIIGCLSTGYISGGKQNLFERFIKEDSKVFIYNDRHSTQYLLLNQDSTFVYESHQDIKYAFSIGTYSVKNGGLIFYYDKMASYNCLKEYCGSITDCDYTLARDSFDKFEHKLYEKQIISTKNKRVKKYDITYEYQDK